MKASVTLLLFVVFLCFTNANAQQRKSVALSLGVEALFPLAIKNAQNQNARDFFGNGASISFKAELPLSAKLFGTFSAGYANYSAPPVYYGYFDPRIHYSLPSTAFNYDTFPVKYMPLNAGLRYYMIKYFFAQVETGGALKLTNSGKTSFIYSGGLGGFLPLGIHSGIEISATYGSGYKVTSSYYTSPMHQLSFKAAYRYQL